MDFESLRQGNFSSLGTAVNDWSSVVKSLTTMEKNARDDFKAKADKADWSGANATVTREFVTEDGGRVHRRTDSGNHHPGHPARYEG
ncbi:hypothetical protein ACFRK5_18550 [Streptomyces niveus]|uniref:hypothetical protein n=1 Tax=Streptomyces niveus TaxID=193462 RepID=UPI0036958CEF